MTNCVGPLRSDAKRTSCAKRWYCLISVIGPGCGVPTPPQPPAATASGVQLLVIAAPAVSYDAQKNIVVADTSKATLGEQVASN